VFVFVCENQREPGFYLSGGEYGSVGGLLDVLEELGLGGTRISEQEHIDVASKPVLALDVLWLPSKQGKGNASLDILMAINRGCNALDDLLADAGILGHLADGTLVILGQSEGGKEILFLPDVGRLDNSGEDGESILGVQGDIKVVAVNTSDLLLC